jgi:hypothetical protein
MARKGLLLGCTEVVINFLSTNLGFKLQESAKTYGHLKPLKQAWHFRGFVVLDGWDPEGNIVQFKQVEVA